MTDKQITLFNLHECMQDAAYEEPAVQPKPLNLPRQVILDAESIEDAFNEAMSESWQRENIGVKKTKLPEGLMRSSFVVEEETKRQLDMICRAHGTTASAFLRQCTRRLVREYQLPTP